MRDGMHVDEYGNRRWYVNNRLHRTDGPAIEYADGTREWWLNGKLHRIDGPAVEWPDGTRAWYVNGKRHRTDGPAIEFANGTREWWLNDKRYFFREWLEVNTEVTPQQKMLLMLKYGDG